ncbi:hypothetical protein [Chitinophaga sp. OAE865]
MENVFKYILLCLPGISLLIILYLFVWSWYQLGETDKARLFREPVIQAQ